MLEPATEEFKQKVCQKFNTSPQQVQKDVEVLKEWIRQQPHLPQCSSDTLLTTFLIACKNRMERAKEKIDNYYTLRMKIPTFFADRDPELEGVRANAEEIRYFLLPKSTPEGYRVHMNLLVSGDMEKFDIPTYLKRVMLTEDVRYDMEPFSLGEYVVMDFKLFKMAHILRITPTLVKDFMTCVQNSMPLIVKGIFLINSPPYIELGINIVKPFMKQKILERMVVHTEGPEILEKYFPRKMLPKDYGGEEETSEKLQEACNQLLREKRDWLMGEGSLTVDESKRIGGPRKNGEFEEIQGSFKALCVD